MPGARHAAGVPGEIVVQGEGVALGYLDDPAASASSTRTTARALPHRRHRPLAAEGVVEYLGRKDAQVKIRGHRVEPQEVAGRGGAARDRQAAVLARPGRSARTWLPACAANASPTRCCARRWPSACRRTCCRRASPGWSACRSPPAASSISGVEQACRARPGASARSCRIALEAALLAVWRACLPGPLDRRPTSSRPAATASRHAGRAPRRPRTRRACSALQLFRTPTVRGLAAALAAPVPP